MKTLNVQERNIFQNVLKHSQKINVNVQNSNNEFIFKLDEDFCSKDKHSKISAQRTNILVTA